MITIVNSPGPWIQCMVGAILSTEIPVPRFYSRTSTPSACYEKHSRSYNTSETIIVSSNQEYHQKTRNILCTTRSVNFGRPTISYLRISGLGDNTVEYFLPSEREMKTYQQMSSHYRG